MSKEHPHAELLRAIADGKKIVRHGMHFDTSAALALIASGETEYLAIAPDTITVNGIEVPAPYRGPMQNGQKYWVVDTTLDNYARCWMWRDDPMYRLWRARGLIHLDESAAAAHGRAMAAASSQEGGAA